MPEQWANWLMERDIPAMRGFDHTIAAIKAAHQASQPSRAVTLSGLAARMSLGQSQIINKNEHEGKTLLAQHGITIPHGGIAESQDEAIALASDRLVVMKAVSAELSHKTEADAVRLGIKGKDQVAEAYRHLSQISPQVLVEDMITDSVAEVIIGISRDPVVGLYLMLGTGGVMAELLRDTITLIMPSPAEEIEKTITQLKAGALIRGWRGKAKGDLKAAVAAILSVQDIALDCQDKLEDLEINPLMIRPEGKGVVAVDVLIRVNP
ncbi:MAG: hypothetical protein EBZ18_06950 [Alphaproteobacteria bacterium]|nr:hypothetical protein [Alphaproteobacteria bacterium]